MGFSFRIVVMFFGLAMACRGNFENEPCRGIECSGHGICLHDDSRAVCLCDTGYTPVDLECLPAEADADADSDSELDADLDNDGDSDADADNGENGDADAESDAEEVPDADDEPCVPSVEVCNEADDDCNGIVDNGFDLENDPDNCGGCGDACGPLDECVAGECTPFCPPDCDCEPVACGGRCDCSEGCRCNIACGSFCDVHCDDDETVCVVNATPPCDLSKLECSSGAACYVDVYGCDELSDDAACKDAGTFCDVNCDGVEDCALECASGAECILRCADGANCEFRVCDGDITECAGHIAVCNGDCPE